MGGIAAPSWLDKPVNEQTLPLSTRREESRRAASFRVHLHTEFSGFRTQAEALTVTTSHSRSLVFCAWHFAAGSAADPQALRSQLSPSLPGCANNDVAPRSVNTRAADTAAGSVSFSAHLSH